MSAARPLLICPRCAAGYDEEYIEHCECDVCLQPGICPTCWACACERGIGDRPRFPWAAGHATAVAFEIASSSTSSA